MLFISNHQYQVMPINVKPEGGVGVGTLTFSGNISLSKHHSPEQPGWSKVAK